MEFNFSLEFRSRCFRTPSINWKDLAELHMLLSKDKAVELLNKSACAK